MKHLIIYLISFFLFGCLAKNIIKKPLDLQHLQQNEYIYKEIIKVAQNGDWLIIRGYHAADNLIMHATQIPISHAGIVDFDSLLVIEAEGNGIHTSQLIDFIDKAHRIIVIRPKWSNQQNHDLALANARQLINKKYDFLGLIGFNFPDKFYCSELAVYIYKEWYDPRQKLPKVIKPGELYLYGQILFDSLDREEILLN